MAAQSAPAPQLVLSHDVEPSLVFPRRLLLPPVPRRLQGIYDIRRAVDAALAGQVLHALALGAVASTLSAAQEAESALRRQQPTPAALLALAEGIGGGMPVQQAIGTCIPPGDGRILDSASEALAGIRAQRRANQAQLRREMEAWVRQLHAKGICERPQVGVIDGSLWVWERARLALHPACTPSWPASHVSASCCACRPACAGRAAP